MSGIPYIGLSNTSFVDDIDWIRCRGRPPVDVRRVARGSAFLDERSDRVVDIERIVVRDRWALLFGLSSPATAPHAIVRAKLWSASLGACTHDAASLTGIGWID